MIRIADVLARLQHAGLLAQSADRIGGTVTGISDDSRKVRPGDLYCAIRGYVHDGHRYLKDAREAGAAAALVEVPEAGVGLTQIRVADSRRAAAVAAQVVLGEPTAELRLVGVTGTNGKTTTVHLARHVLSSDGPAGSLGTLGVVAADGERTPTELTTLGPIDFARQLAGLRAEGVKYVVAEVSSHALAQGRVEGANFDAAVFTNLSRDHLDYHTDFEAYRAAKARLAELVKVGGALIVNADDPAWTDLRSPGRRIRYAMAGDAEYRARDVVLGGEGSRWTLVTPRATAALKLPLLGGFNVANALAAATLARAYGLGITAVVDALACVPPVPGRLEVLKRRPMIVRDFAHTPDALRVALGALRPLVGGRLIVVFGCGGDRDPGKRPLMGRVAAEGADYVIVSSDNPRSEPPEKIVAEILPGVGAAAHEVEVDRRAAIGRALGLAGPNDAVLLAGKGHETYQIVGDERRPFDEALIVEEYLAARAGKR